MQIEAADGRAAKCWWSTLTLRWLVHCQLLALIAMLVFLPGVARAQLTLAAGVEIFNWEENTSPAVSEDGLFLTLGVGYTQQVESGFLLAYRGKLWTGTADYTGATLFTNVPITGNTAYLGLTNEVQARYRKQLKNNYRRDLLAGIGLDIWQRELSSVQQEDFEIIYVRAGFDIDSVAPGSWLIGFGLKYPVWVREDAHLTDIGFDSNPELNPGGEISAYGQVGYRFNRKWNIVGYVDGYRLTRSNAEPVNEVARGFGPVTVFQPQSDMLVIGIRLEWAIP
jgi:hypothetical protein